MRLPRFITKWALKSLDLAIVPSWLRTNFLAPLFKRLVDEGYKANAAVFSIVSAYAFAFPEAPLRVADATGTLLPDDPLQKLLNRPNEDMDWVEFAVYVITYLCIGANCYLHKQVDKYGVVHALYPYHPGQMEAVPSPTLWTDHYNYTNGDGKVQAIPRDEVIHLKWPSIDPDKPWLGYSPLLAVAREVDTDTEASRYLYALLKNDAVPQTLYSFPKPKDDEEDVPDSVIQDFKAMVREKLGGEGRGGPMVARGGLSVQRIGLNLKELALDALRAVPEARMCAAWRIPAIVAGLNVGLDKATYANFAEARSMWTQNTIVPLWIHIAGAMERGLLDANDKRTLRFDTSKVGALQLDATALSTRKVAEYLANIITKNEARGGLGYPKADDGDVYASDVAFLAQQAIQEALGTANATGATTEKQYSRAA